MRTNIDAQPGGARYQGVRRFFEAEYRASLSAPGGGYHPLHGKARLATPRWTNQKSAGTAIEPPAGSSGSNSTISSSSSESPWE